MMFVAFVFIIPVVLGLLMAAGIYKYGRTAAYDANMKPLIANDMHWVYLAVVVLGRCVSFVNMFPMGYKSKVCALQIFASQICNCARTRARICFLGVRAEGTRVTGFLRG